VLSIVIEFRLGAYPLLAGRINQNGEKIMFKIIAIELILEKSGDYTCFIRVETRDKVELDFRCKEPTAAEARRGVARKWRAYLHLMAC